MKTLFERNLVEEDANMDKMKKFFEKRTNNHIKAVQDIGKKIYESDPEKFKGLMELLKVHDASKFKEPEYTPYLYVTWKYKAKDDGIDFEIPEGMDDKMNEATTYHVLNNSHHPEYHAGEDSGIINKGDRDKPVRDKVIDGSGMSDVNIAEMVADWAAVGAERGNSAKDWADDNIDTRWEFTPGQTELIYELIELVEK